MHWTEEREAQANLGKALEAEGAEIYGWRDDDSDPYTDYFAPETWAGVATYRDHIICVGVSTYWAESHSGTEDWPLFQANPKGFSWHVEKDGEIMFKGKGLNRCQRMYWREPGMSRPGDYDSETIATEIESRKLARQILRLIDKMLSSRMEPSLSAKSEITGREPGRVTKLPRRRDQ